MECTLEMLLFIASDPLKTGVFTDNRPSFRGRLSRQQKAKNPSRINNAIFQGHS